ncbi:MAG: uracil-DNA glycosylase [Desulfurococcales archaeon]|nr:uracil-DNA glycosylase [Desulfurococcales archaeon]
MKSKREEYQRLVNKIVNCTKCPLHKFRKNPVPGEGSLDSDIMFVGEAPGRKEDEQGRPFVGMAGKLLSALLSKIGLRRDEVYITNIVKCRPPGNRDPRPEEIQVCLPYLLEQIRIIRPRIIVTLGRHSGRTLFETARLKWAPLSRIHGKPYTGVVGDVNVTLYPTYHPAAALYNPNLREVLEQDFRKLAELLEEIHRKPKTRKTLFDYM